MRLEEQDEGVREEGQVEDEGRPVQAWEERRSTLGRRGESLPKATVAEEVDFAEVVSQDDAREAARLRTASVRDDPIHLLGVDEEIDELFFRRSGHQRLIVDLARFDNVAEVAGRQTHGEAILRSDVVA